MFTSNTDDQPSCKKTKIENIKSKKTTWKALRMRRDDEPDPNINTIDEIPTVAEIIRIIKQPFKYTDITTRSMKVKLRKSSVKRRGKHGVKDIDIVSIIINRKRKGIATLFFKRLIVAAKALRRGVFIEQCITHDSQYWSASLLRKELVSGYHKAYYGGATCNITGFADFLSTYN
jgi:hypothetical protein